MENVLVQAAENVHQGYRKRKWWHRVVSMMTAIVVFCTTYVLILPALTMEGDAICGFEAHEHSEGCYSRQQIRTLTCGEDGIHSHDSFCYDETGALACPLPEINEHTHDDTCMTTETVLVCGLEETEGHAHDDVCSPAETVLICAEEHDHGEECYTVRYGLCMQPETAAHAHTDACWEQRQTITCTAHRHTVECLTEETVEELVCDTPIHIHADSCFPSEESDSFSKYLCGSGEHTHAESCYDAAGTLTCSIPVHTHEAACLVADLDLTAGVENQRQWEQTLEAIELTGSWPADLLAVAESQLGYLESEKNVVLAGDDLMGYTRYGQWYGDPYGEWCAMFVSFCLHYAGVADFPLESGCTRWIEDLTEEGLYAEAGDYIPKAGDLIFFDFQQKRNSTVYIPVDADHVGIVAEVIPATDTQPAKIRTIEGNTGGKVAYRTYTMDDPTIVGFGILPAGETIVLAHQGADYTVTVSFGREAMIPETATLAVEEILPGTDEYNTYYQQSVAAMLDSGTAVTEEELGVSFARFFDITFLVDGQAVEPAAPVDVQISYTEAFPGGGENGVAVHFADDGIEVLDAEVSQADTFAFTQDSFSVVGTVMSTYVRSVASNTATRISPYSIDGSGNTLYVIYTQIGGQWYAIDGNGYAVPITVNGSTVTLGQDATNDVFWSFAGGNNNAYVIWNAGTSRHLHSYNNGGTNTGTTTAGAWSSTLYIDGNGVRIQGAGGNYAYFPSADVISRATTDWWTAGVFYIGQVGQYYNVWFDGTNGGMMSYYGADDRNLPAVRNSDGTATVILPETWKSSTKYAYTLQGWYDINTQIYYPVDPTDSVTPTVTITQDSVFYADWVAATYDVGQDNEHVVDSLDTDSFITTYVFDYNALFNVLSQTHTGSISRTDHSETWTVHNNGETVPYSDDNALGFVFVDYDSDGEFSYAYNRDTTNINQGDKITAGILQEVMNVSGQDLIDLLFNPDTDVIGKYYAGEGNYLYQYMDSTTANYDGEHDGYYYLDARLNAASYNQSLQRFYLYDYLERTSDSRKDGYMNPVGQYSDLLPFNSPYLFDSSQLDEYVDSVMRPGYEYDAKDGETDFTEYNNTGDATTNYFFGIRSDIEFFLPNDSGSRDEYGNYGNISTRGEHMVFDFHGDDDVWVFIDGELVLDIGGLHGIMHGRIDFSTGTVTAGRDGSETTVSFQDLLGHNITEGTHTMQVYYMERGSSQSNCAIYFNIAPRYDLEITKEDIFSAEKLNGAVFQIFTCEGCANTCLACVSDTCETHEDPVPACDHYTSGGALHVAQLWESRAAYETDMADSQVDDARSTFEVVDGVAKCWGISAGKTYYIREITPPDGYPASDDLIRITLNNRGTATIETTTLLGANGIATEGFAVIKQDINETLKIVALTVTNQKDGDTTEIRVQKTWAPGSENLPDSIVVYLTADGESVGRQAILNEANGWAYTWKGLPKYAEGSTDKQIVYEVQEVLVPDYITTQGDSVQVDKFEDWIRVAQMSDSKTYLLVHNGKMLSYDTGGFGWVDLPLDDEGKILVESVKDDNGNIVKKGIKDLGVAIQWNVTTDHDGFHLKNGLKYTLTFDDETTSFYGINNDEVALNQVIYYLNSRLVVHDHDAYYQFGDGGTAVADDGLAFTLYQQEIFTGWMTGITNTPVEEEDQTFVEITKVWQDGNEKHLDDSVTIRLFADGEDTGRTLVLNAGNNWTGGFYDLPYYQADGTTVVEYTVEEEHFGGYGAFYSDPATLAGLPVTLWHQTAALAAGQTYRFVSGNNVLTVDGSGNVTGANNNLTSNYQQWLAVDRNGTIVLENVGTGRYLSQSNTALTTVGEIGYAAAVTMENGYVKVGSMYLEIGAGYAQVTSNAANITNQKVFYQEKTTGKDGTGYTVTNVPSIYELPHTGSLTPHVVTFGGLLILAAALMYVIYFGRKRQKGGV